VSAPTTVLLTGFEPFEQQEVNASWAAVRAVAADWDEAAEGARLVTGLLPVSFARAPRRLASLLAEARPDLVVCVGEAGGRSAVGVERVAVNVQDARIPDEDGAQPVDAPVVPGGDVAHFSSLPVKACLAALRDAGVPGEVSNTAGSVLRLMHTVRNRTRGETAHLTARPSFTCRPTRQAAEVHSPRRSAVPLV
jgi:pyroglutamyl-peptidase